MPVSVDDNVRFLLEPDAAVIRQHLELLFRRAQAEYPEGRCEIAWSDGTGHVTTANVIPNTAAGLDRATGKAVEENRRGRNVYVGVNPRKPSVKEWGRCATADVEIAFYQFAEIDSAEGTRELRRAPLAYTWAVTTGRVPHPRVHAYWQVEEPIRNLSAWSAQQKALAETFTGDSMSNPDRILRLAGTVSYPSEKKIRAGYRVEKVTLRYLYDGEERPPVASATLFSVYPWAEGGVSVDLETGEISEPPAGGVRVARDPLEWVRNIDAGTDLHNNARDLAAHLVETGHRNWLIKELLTRILAPVSDGGTLGQIPKLIQSARLKYRTPDPADDYGVDGTTVEAPELILKPIGVLNPQARAPRDWLVPYRMMRRHVTMTTAAPGVGKSTLAIEEAVSLASGVDFLGFGIKRAMRVAIINNEETRDELERRIEATCAHFDVSFESIAERLFIYSGVDAEKLILARADKNGNVIPTVQTVQLSALVTELKLDLLILDPFVQTHYVEESSNEQISRAMVQMRSIGAGEYPAAVHIVHHNRKPAAGNSHQAGDLSAARGASSMGGEAHFFFTLSDMGEKDAESLNIAEEDRLLYLRLDDAKRKMAPVTAARWFERHGVHMPYGKFGEEVGVLIPKEFEELDIIVTVASAREMLQTIDKAWRDGNPYSESPVSASRYVVNVIMREFQMSRQNAKHLVRDWMKNGMIQTELFDKKNKMRGLRVVKWPG